MQPHRFLAIIAALAVLSGCLGTNDDDGPSQRGDTGDTARPDGSADSSRDLPVTPDSGNDVDPDDAGADPFVYDGPTDDPPTVTITSPGDGETVIGDVTFAATASDDIGVLSVQFFIDSGLLREDSSVPYSVTWSTEDFTEGLHTLKAIAHDTTGHTGEAQIQVTVAGPESEGACTEESDREFIGSYEDDFSLYSAFAACRSAVPDDSAWIYNCIMYNQESLDLSAGCSLCGVQWIACAVGACPTECDPDPPPPCCGTCQEATDCVANFWECAGVGE